MVVIDYLLEEGGFAPEFAFKDDIGADIRSPEKFTLYPGKQITLDTKLRIFCSPGFYGEIVPKSGLAAHNGITITNSPGSIDTGYTGKIKVILLNTGKYNHEFQVGDKVAQIIIKKKEKVEYRQVLEIPITDRSEGGLGHTGK